LADLGQAVLCTIHQPSSLLIEQFDRVFALAPGGHCYYFGPLGQNCEDVVKYFGARGAICPPNANIAEFLLDAGVGNVRANHKRIDWVDIWQKSMEFEAVKKEVEQIASSRKQLTPSTKVHAHEFAASTLTQTILLTTRLWRNYWRSPSYGYGNLFTTFSTALIAGFTFWKLGNSEINLQERMFAAFMFIFLPAPMMNATIPKVLCFPYRSDLSSLKQECYGRSGSYRAVYMDGLHFPWRISWWKFLMRLSSLSYFS
jgi:ATP-binding cassette, subfamily G (WHITE), member 2, SNQ2